MYLIISTNAKYPLNIRGNAAFKKGIKCRKIMDIFNILTIILSILFGILTFKIIKILQKTEEKIEKLERNQKKICRTLINIRIDQNRAINGF